VSAQVLSGNVRQEMDCKQSLAPTLDELPVPHGNWQNLMG